MSINYDMKPLKQRMTSLNASFGQPNLYAVMNSIHHYFVNKSQDMFASESDPDGRAWAALKQSTISFRRSLGFGPSPINYRTGKLYRYIVNSRPDILGHSDGVISYAFPQRAWPDKSVRWRLEQASGLIRGGPARRVIGMNATDADAVLAILQRNVLEH